MVRQNPSSAAKYKYFILTGVILLAVAFATDWVINRTNTTVATTPFIELPEFKITPQTWKLSNSQQANIEHIQAKAVVLINENTGEILASREADTRYPMASTTKIMTAALALEFTDPNSLITIPENVHDNLPPDSALMGVTPGEQYAMEELLYGLMLNSGNDAAQAIAMAVSGSEQNFVALMNAKADQLGLKDTHFTNASGLDHPDHYSTAKELAVIAHYARSFPLFKQIVATPAISLPYSSNHKQLELTNLNPLITTYQGATGIKPGNTGEAGNCLVASANRNGNQFIGVLLDTPGRNTNMAALFDIGFNSIP